MRIASCRLFRLACCLLVLVPAATRAQVSLVYRQWTGPEEVRIEIRQQALPPGAVLEAAMSNGESYRIESDATGGVVACSFDFPREGTSWSARRDGETLRLAGTVRGRPVQRTFAVGRHPWYESAEHSLQSRAVSGSRVPFLFWMVQPYEGRAYLMSGRIERREPVHVNGRSVEAVRIIVRPAGLLAFLWSSTYWYDPLDGTFLRSQSLRGILARDPTVIELVEDRRHDH